jgi:hypothetical protein
MRARLEVTDVYEEPEPVSLLPCVILVPSSGVAAAGKARTALVILLSLPSVPLHDSRHAAHSVDMSVRKGTHGCHGARLET